MTPRLRSRYLGLDLPSPLVASASPLTARVDALLRLEEAGAGAIVLPSLFAEQIEHDAFETPEDIGRYHYLPDLDGYNTGPEMYLQLVEEAKRALHVPVIASLNGTIAGRWVRFVSNLEAAGADAIELSINFVAADPAVAPEAVELRYVDLVTSIRERISIPLAVKVVPFFTAFGNTARRLATAGAGALVLFNRFIEPDLDIEARRIVPRAPLSSSEDLLVPMRWIAILRGRLDVDLAASTGVHSAEDALKVIMAGADVAMLTSALLRHGPGHLGRVLEGMSLWMESHGADSLDELRGCLSQSVAADPEAFERMQYLKAISSYMTPYA